jgi:fumarylacetoacetase
VSAPQRSWVPGADGSGFGIEHLPYGVIRGDGAPRPAVRIGERALDLALLSEEGLLGAADGLPADSRPLDGIFEQPTLNGFLELGPGAWAALRTRLTELLAAGADELQSVAGLAERALLPLDEVELALPIAVADYVDFYSSLEHATNVGALIRPDDPLMPNWRHLPVGYHGRSGTVVVGGSPVRRPLGQGPPEGPEQPPSFGPESRLDFELELGFVTGPGPEHGGPIAPHAAARHIFGFALVNDWSARTIQVWEYQPLGPFLGKSFATSIGPWITPLAALEPFRVPGPEQDPPPHEYLRSDEPWALDLELEAALVPAGSGEEHVITRTNARGLYWSCAQQLAHATVNGATVRAGDLYASGTISGFEPGTHGSLLEATRAGQEPLRLPDGAERAFLEDGDEVILRGAGAPGEGRPAITLAEVRGRIEPAR